VAADHPVRPTAGRVALCRSLTLRDDRATDRAEGITMDDNRPRFPLSEPPAKPKSWWGTIPGQASILVIIGGVLFIVLGLAGAFDSVRP
jgi:hypothetical protein